MTQNRNFVIHPSQLFHWVKMKNDNIYTKDIHQRCQIDYLKKQLTSDVQEVVSIELNDTGKYVEPGMMLGIFNHSEETDLPAYYRVILN